MTEPSVGILTTDIHLVVRTWDDWLSQVTGIASEEARGKPLSALAPDTIKRAWQDRFQAVLAEGSIQVMAPTFHHYLIPCPPQTPSEHFIQMQQRVTIAPLRDEETIIGTIVSVEDVTARRNREIDLTDDLASPDEAVRLRAAQAIANESGVMSSGDMLLGSVGDDSWRVRRVAVDQLARDGSSQAVTVLVRALRDEHHNLSVLNSALQVLTMSGLDTLTPLIEFLNSPDTDLRIYAALALGEQRDPRAITPLVQALDDPDVNVRYHAIEALGRLRAATATGRLVEVAESHDFFLAFPAIAALEEIGAPGIATRLLPLLQDELLAAPVAALLGKRGGPDVIAPLVTALNTPRTPTPALAQALATLYDRETLRSGNGEPVAEQVRNSIAPHGIQSLLDTLETASPEELRAIALVLGWIRDPAAESALTRLMGQPQTRDQVVDALVKHGPSVFDLLVTELGVPDLETREAAAIALGRMGDARAVPALMRLLDAEPELVVIAAGALAKIGDRSAFEPLLGMIGNPNSAVRQAVISALNSLGHPDMCNHMGELLRDRNPYVRESAARITGYFGYGDCVDILLDLTHDPEEPVRRAAIESIAYLEHPRVFQILADALERETPAVRAAAARGMSHVDHPQAVAQLLGALKDEDLWVRYFAARALGNRRYRQAHDALVQLARTDPASPVRIAAITALGNLGEPGTREVLESFVQDPEPDIARAAANALTAHVIS